MKNSKSKLINTIDQNPAVQVAFMCHSEDEIDREDVIAAVIAAYEANQQDTLAQNLAPLTKHDFTQALHGYGRDFVPLDEVRGILATQQDTLRKVREALEEAVVLMEDTRVGAYVPDSFTTQPWVSALALLKDVMGEV